MHDVIDKQLPPPLRLPLVHPPGGLRLGEGEEDEEG